MSDQGGHTPTPGPTGGTTHPGTPGQTPTEIDTTLQPFFELTLSQVAALFDHAGLPKDRRSLMRYCAQDKLDCEKIENQHGEQWFVDETSVHRLIASIMEKKAMTPTHPGTPGQTPTSQLAEQSQNEKPDTPRQDPRPTGAYPGTPGQESEDDTPGAAGQSTTHSDTGFDQKMIDHLMGEVDFLKGELTVKNQTIETLLERDRETNVLISGLQSLVLKLTGNAHKVIDMPQDDQTPQPMPGEMIRP